MGMSPMEFQMFLGMVPQKFKDFTGELSFEGLDAGKCGKENIGKFASSISLNLKSFS